MHRARPPEPQNPQSSTASTLTKHAEDGAHDPRRAEVLRRCKAGESVARYLYSLVRTFGKMVSDGPTPTSLTILRKSAPFPYGRGLPASRRSFIMQPVSRQIAKDR